MFSAIPIFEERFWGRGGTAVWKRLIILSFDSVIATYFQELASVFGDGTLDFEY